MESVRSGILTLYILILFLWPGPQRPDKRWEKHYFPLLSSPVNMQAPWQGHSLRSGPSFFHSRQVNLFGLEEPFCLDNKNNEVLLRYNIIVLCPRHLWLSDFYIQPILFCKAPKGSVHTIQTKHNKEAFYTLLWP